jgi:hypothetical protein
MQGRPRLTVGAGVAPVLEKKLAYAIRSEAKDLCISPPSWTGL